MSFLGTVVSSLKVFQYRSDDDLSDRLHYLFTSNLLIALSVLVSFKQFGGKPIECFSGDAHDFGSALEDYAENYCFASNTYFVKWDKLVPEKLGTREDKELNYYQWVPFFLLLQAAAFQIPCLIWKLMSGRSGIRIHCIIEQAINPKNLEAEARRETIRMLSVHLENAFRFQRRLDRKKLKPHRFIRLLNLPYTGSYVSVLYIIIKILYLVNVVGQFKFMNVFLETDQFNLFGFQTVRNILNGTQWEESGAFPRVTLCDFEYRGVGQNRRYTLQCVLAINIFNEKIFIALWFWYNIVILVTMLSLIYWITVLVIPIFNRWFITRSLELSEIPFDSDRSSKDVQKFMASYLKRDGVFVLRMVTMHTNIIFGTDLCQALWRSFYGIEEQVPGRKKSTCVRQQSQAPCTPGLDQPDTVIPPHPHHLFHSKSYAAGCDRVPMPDTPLPPLIDIYEDEGTFEKLKHFLGFGSPRHVADYLVTAGHELKGVTVVPNSETFHRPPPTSAPVKTDDNRTSPYFRSAKGTPDLNKLNSKIQEDEEEEDEDSPSNKRLLK